MLRICLINLLFTTIYAQPNAQDYVVMQAESYKETLAFIKEKRATTYKILSPLKQNIDIVLAIAFPEMLRYHSLSNAFETAMLEVLYTRYGSHYANFSIGRMQMKPSFAELVESELQHYALDKKFATLSQYKNLTPELQRAERVQRLNEWQWQLQYMAAFIALTEAKFAHKIKNYATIAKLRFLATAYNVGFQHDFATIQHWATLYYFPHGKHYRQKQFNYADIACFFYLQHSKKP